MSNFITPWKLPAGSHRPASLVEAYERHAGLFHHYPAWTPKNYSTIIDSNYWFDKGVLKKANAAAVTICTPDQFDFSRYFEGREACMMRIATGNYEKYRQGAQYQYLIVPGRSDEIQEKLANNTSLEAYIPSPDIYRELVISGEMDRFEHPERRAVRDEGRLHSCIAVNGQIYEVDRTAAAHSQESAAVPQV